MCLSILENFEKKKKIILEIGCLNGKLAKNINSKKYNYIGRCQIL